MSMKRIISGKNVMLAIAAGLFFAGQAFGDTARPGQAKPAPVQAEQGEIDAPDGGEFTGVPPDWSDDMESYVNGSDIDGQGGWQSWDSCACAGALITQAQAQGGLQSLDVVGNSDIVHINSVYNCGTYLVQAFVWIPSGLDAVNDTWFIMQKEYNDGGPYQWSIQFRMAADGTVDGDCGASNNCNDTTWNADAWNEILAVIDIDGDVSLLFNGFVLGTYNWQNGVFGTDNGCPAVGGCIQSFDLFAFFSASSVYYDTLSITYVPESEVCGDGVDNDCDGDVDCDDSDCAGDPACAAVNCACCFEDGTCQQLTDVDCEAAGGTCHPDEDCANVDCAAIPTVSEWGMIALTVLLLFGAGVVIRKR
ncbi:MAG: IPTL-CTERM sorting domain-containing protein, partial [Planctomycetes bacterium]|nr:IPTL-CTERM sorting domain-containing protein [Planctomycetota bacterium]